MSESNVALVTITILPPPISYNCECEDDDPAHPMATLSELRRRMMVRLGYGASASRPAPGMIELIDDFLQQSQLFLYNKIPTYRTKRFFRWPLVEGVRFYDLAGNDDVCRKPMMTDMIDWVGNSRGGDVDTGRGEQWNRLVCGIPPEFYSGGIQNSWPTHYEIRQCIEVWPAPSADAGYLRVKANFGLGRFTEPEDKTTIDPELVFMFALANAKAHYGKPDAQTYGGMAQSRIGDLIAGTHMTRRYIPGESPVPTPPAPVMKGGFIPNG